MNQVSCRSSIVGILGIATLVLAMLAAVVLGGCGGGGGRGKGTPPALSQSKDNSAVEDASPQGQKERAADEADEVPGVQDLADDAAATRADDTRTVDQDDAIRGGTSAYWHRVTGYGYDGDMMWTYVNGSSRDDYMIWRSGWSGGRITISVFIPRNHATTRSARYQVGTYGGGRFSGASTIIVNQNAISDQWVALGTFDLSGEPAVMLGDDTGESYASTKRKVGFDGVRFTRVPVAPPPPALSGGVSKALGKAHAELGSRPVPKYFCLYAVRRWFDLPGRYATAAACADHFRRAGVLQTTARPTDAPYGAWVFYDWRSGGSNVGHVAARCPEGIVQQDSSAQGAGRIAHNTSGNVGNCTYIGYVTYENVMSKY